MSLRPHRPDPAFKPETALEIALTADEAARVLRLVAEVASQRGCSPSQAIDLLARDASDGPIQGRSLRLGLFAERLMRLRARRQEFMGHALFRDPAWDMLLDMFSAHERGDRLSVSALCYASGVPPTTALRHLERLEKAELMSRQDDPVDHRRSWVDPTEASLKGMSLFLTALVEEAAASTALRPTRAGAAER